MERWARAKYQPSLPLGKDGKRVTLSQEHIVASKDAAKEGMVLLKNDRQVLPIRDGKRIALFGKGLADYVQGGGGSAMVYGPYTRSIADGFEALNREGRITMPLFQGTLDYYRQEVKKQYAEGIAPGMVREPQLPDTLVQQAAMYADLAVIVISRFSGEAWDRTCEGDKGKEIIGVDEAALMQRASEVFPKGDFYLTDEEEQMVEKVCSAFSDVAVVFNVGGMIDTTWFAHNDRIAAALMAWQGGIEGGLAAAELLCGIGTPSGCLTDTYVQRLEDYPGTDTFHDSPYNVDYFEDIYVGYRYFETIPGAAEKVVYPFGYGLSYTRFTLEQQGMTISSERADAMISLTVNVTNVGSYRGRKTVQVYYQAPQGLLGKPSKVLAGFAKTKELAPGESQLLTIAFPATQMSSYDDLGKIAEAAWVMEKGSYRLYVGEHVQHLQEALMTFDLEEDVVVSQLSHRLSPVGLVKRMRADGSFEDLPYEEEALRVEPGDANRNMAMEQPTYRPRQLEAELMGYGPAWRGVAPLYVFEQRQPIRLIDVAEGRKTLDELIAAMSDEDLAWMLGGQPNTGVANTFGFGGNQVFGIPAVMSADGPAGIRIHPDTGVQTTAFPCAASLACSFDPEVLYKVGRCIGMEAKENNISVWLAPGICIHRSPLCGRNFEYYSEDPLVAATLAGAVIEGCQSVRVAATVKHFAFNNKECNRRSANARVSERAAREIYLKAFEIIMKEHTPWAVMTSYNPVNSQRCSESSDLLNGILRGEWGYEGMVMTDWWGHGEQYLECKAGGDVKMAVGWPERLLDAVKNGALTREEMETAVRHVLNMILKLD